MILKYTIPLLFILVVFVLCLGGYYYPEQLPITIIVMGVGVVAVMAILTQTIVVHRLRLIALRLENSFLLSRADPLTKYYLREFNQNPKKVMQIEAKSETNQAILPKAELQEETKDKAKNQAVVAMPTPAPQSVIQQSGEVVTQVNADLVMAHIRNPSAFFLGRSPITHLSNDAMAHEKLELLFNDGTLEQGVTLNEVISGAKMTDQQMMMIFARFIILMYKYKPLADRLFIAIEDAILGCGSLQKTLLKMKSFWPSVAKRSVLIVAAEQFLQDKIGNYAQIHRDQAQFALLWHGQLLDADYAACAEAGVRYIIMPFNEFVALRQDDAGQQVYDRLITTLKAVDIQIIIQGLNSLTSPQSLVEQGVLLSIDSDMVI